MPVQISGLREAQLADLTLIGLFTAVNPEMLGQSRAVSKRFLADLALVRSFSGVRAHVGSHGRRLRETTVTERAFEWPFATVCSHVSVQVGCLRESLEADLTAERAVTSHRPVSPAVTPQRGPSVESLYTDWTAAASAR